MTFSAEKINTLSNTLAGLELLLPHLHGSEDTDARQHIQDMLSDPKGVPKRVQFSVMKFYENGEKITWGKQLCNALAAGKIAFQVAKNLKTPCSHCGRQYDYVEKREGTYDLCHYHVGENPCSFIVDTRLCELGRSQRIN